MLVEVAVAMPQTKGELGAIRGFGEAKVARYGDEVLVLVPRGMQPGAGSAEVLP
jgi:hypothetical protein